VSFDVAMARVTELQSILGGAAVPAATTATPTATGQDFATMLRTATVGGAATATAAPGGATAVAAPTGGSVGARMVALAQGEVGQAEQPPGSNNSARIATYRTATAGSMVAPWCAYFTSWLARESGAPVGARGEGHGSVDALYAWAQGAGKAIPASSGQPPQPGDLIVWDEHIGIVEAVLPDGRIQTIEGNSSDRVSRRVHPAGNAIGYVRLG
jgi:hypothetical protein